MGWVGPISAPIFIMGGPMIVPLGFHPYGIYLFAHRRTNDFEFVRWVFALWVSNTAPLE